MTAIAIGVLSDRCDQFPLVESVATLRAGTKPCLFRAFEIYEESSRRSEVGAGEKPEVVVRSSRQSQMLSMDKRRMPTLLVYQ